MKKLRKHGQVVSVETEQVYGTKDKLKDTLELSSITDTVNTSFVERQNGMDRHLNARKARKTLEFSKDNKYHVCQSWLIMTYYNFCWDHSSLRIGTMDMKYVHCRSADQRKNRRSPMIALGVADHIWLIEDMVSYQVIKDH